MASKLQNIWEEIQRRKVGKVTLAYLAGAWVLIEVSSVVFPALMFPEWTGRAVVIGAIVLLPVVVILSWIYDLTAKGVTRTPTLLAAGVTVAVPDVIVGRDDVIESLQDGMGAFPHLPRPRTASSNS